MKKSKAGKWRVLGFSDKEYDIIYQRLRQEAKGMIIKKHNKEYLKVLRKLRTEYLKEFERGKKD